MLKQMSRKFGLPGVMYVEMHRPSAILTGLYGLGGCWWWKCTQRDSELSCKNTTKMDGNVYLAISNASFSRADSIFTRSAKPSGATRGYSTILIV